MFADSINVSTARYHGDADSAFADLPSITQRPLIAVVPSADELLTDEEHDLARELTLHFAAALLSESRE
jgi:hypothetical protein